MSSTVSYANIAAKGTKSVGEKHSLLADNKGGEQVRTAQREVSSSSSVADDVPLGGGEIGGEKTEVPEEAPKSEAAPAAEGSLKKEKKALAPAPVPERSVWGSAAVQPESTTSISVDEHKWPTPDRVIQIESEQGVKNNNQKFIKPFTSKWVPINAKVVLSNTRTGGQKQKNRKNKKQSHQTNQKKQGSSTGSASSGALSAASPVKPGQHEAGDVQHSASEYKGNPQNSQTTSLEHSMHEQNGQFEPYPNQPVQVDGTSPPFIPGAGLNPDDAHQFHGNYGQQGYVDGFRPRFNQNNQNYQQKNLRRFNNGNGTLNAANGPGNGPQHYKQRFNNANPQTQPRNGFFHPQPFVQNQNYQNFNNRQFRPQNGQFRPIQNRNYHPQNGFRNSQIGFTPQQVQIPPPISPQQDPKQALIQQIDYYFSLENLIRDIFLRKNMDSEGWVPLDLILNFKRVKIIINGIQNSSETPEVESETLILDCVKKCTNLEINYKDGKTVENASIGDIDLRVKENHQQWILPAESTN